MFRGSSSRLLTYYLGIMTAILAFFSLAFYILFSHNLYGQLDENLKTLAQVASYSFSQVSLDGEKYFQQPEPKPWGSIFIPEQQGLEWFDNQGKLLASQGYLSLGFAPQLGFSTIKQGSWLKTFTISVSVDRTDANLPSLEGYIRSSQRLGSLGKMREQFLWQLGLTNLVTLAGVTGGGIWLTKKALEPVEQNFRELKQFTGDASHELRTPLTAIKTSVDVMLKHSERFEGKDYRKLEAIARATEQMTSITEDLLFLARTQGTSQPNQAEWQPLGLHYLLPDLCEWLEPLAEEKHLNLECRCLAQANVMGNADQLTRLFRNLIENAIYYTHESGNITLRLIQQNHWAIITVEDTGIGIAAENLSSVFNRFWRGDEARSFRSGGTGLGLSIAQAIAQGHGGTITVSSQVGVGTCFQVYLPLRQAPKSSHPSTWLFRFGQYPGQEWLKKLALILLIISLIILPIFLITRAVKQTQIFAGVQFPNGMNSFANEVISYRINDSQNTQSTSVSNPGAVLGIPQSANNSIFFLINKQNDYISLEKGGMVEVKFSNNLLTGSDDEKPDIYIFMTSETIQDILVEISKDGHQWQAVGWINKERPTIDIDGMGWGKNDFFSYLRLSNVSTARKVQTVSIDAVGAISSVIVESSGSTAIPIATVSLILLAVIVWGVIKSRKSAKLLKN